MANPYYTVSGTPATSAAALSSAMRAEFAAIGVGFDKLAPFTPASSFVAVNAGGTALGVSSSTFAFTSFVPTITFATPGDLSVVYGDQFGQYSKHGRFVDFTVDIRFTPTYTTASGALYIRLTGLPSPQMFAVNSVRSFDPGIPTTKDGIMGYVLQGTPTTVLLYMTDLSATATPLPITTAEVTSVPTVYGVQLRGRYYGLAT